MNDNYSDIPTNITLQNDGPFHIAFAWLAILSASIAAWACLILMVL